MVSESHKKELKKLRALRTSRWFLSAIGLLILTYGIYQGGRLFLDYKLSETTNDAQIEQYISPVNVKVPGYIQKICFTEHQFVHKGDTLLIIDDREYKIRLMEAEAALKDAQAGSAVMASSLNTTKSNASVFDSSIEEAEARLSKLERDYARYSNLLERKATTAIQVDQIKTDLDMAKSRLAALKQQKRTAESSVNEVTKRQGNTEAAILRATAALDMAKLNLSYTVIVAPYNGFLGRRTIEEGQLVNSGQSITYILPDTKKWVTANYKETQIKNLSVGQKVIITVDAMNKKKFTGKIAAISSATGSKYSLIPADNSTGNFVKIQQRIPVRIDFENLSDEDNRKLVAGMMVGVKAKIKH
ncbi:MAG: HlyD family secretion protein [Bacteroidales bacterium]